jgi:hypothetical protein
MGSTTYGTSKSKFKKTKKYKNLCVIIAPFRIIQPGEIYTGEEWEELLLYEVGNSFNEMFEVIEKKKK